MFRYAMLYILLFHCVFDIRGAEPVSAFVTNEIEIRGTPQGGTVSVLSKDASMAGVTVATFAGDTPEKIAARIAQRVKDETHTDNKGNIISPLPLLNRNGNRLE